MLTESQFKSRSKFQGLSKGDKQRRWEQHLASEGLNVTRATNRRVRGRGEFKFDRANNTSISGRVRRAANTVQRLGKKYVPPGSFVHLGGAFAGAPGSAAGAALRDMVGFGDYVPKTNSLITGLRPGDRASFADGSKYHVKRRDFIGEVRTPATPTEFNMTVYPLQITNPMTFPWGSPIGNMFAEWELLGCIIEYVPTSSGYAANTAMGKVAIATEYNSNQTMWPDMRSLCNAEGAISVKPSDPMSHGIECDPALTNSEKLYTFRAGSQGAVNLYNHGQVGVATEGLTAPADTVLGEIWIAYEVALRKPELAPTMPFGQSFGVLTALDQLGGNAFVFDPMSITGPPASTGVATEHGIMFTTSIPVSSNAGTMLALPTQTGAAPMPNMPIDAAEYLVGWFNNDTADRDTTHFSFRVPGVYFVFVASTYAAAAPTAPAAEALLVGSPSGGSDIGYSAVVDVGYQLVTLLSTPTANIASGAWRYRVETFAPGQGISLKNNGTATTTPAREIIMTLVVA